MTQILDYSKVIENSRRPGYFFLISSRPAIAARFGS
jgi:hypothetical protein